MTGRWFSLVSFTIKSDRHDITEILLKVALNTINQNQTYTKRLFTRDCCAQDEPHDKATLEQAQRHKQRKKPTNTLTTH